MSYLIWLERKQAWDSVREALDAALAESGWRLVRLDTEGARARLFLEGRDGPADLWVMAPREGEKAFRSGDGFLFGHGALPGGPTGSTLLEHAFVALQAAAAAGCLARALVRADRPVDATRQLRVEKDGAFDLRLTTACNERCTYCYVDDNAVAAAADVASLPDAQRILSEGRSRGIDAVVVTGGEPTLVPWLRDVLRAARDLGYRQIVLQTNGTCLAAEGFTRTLAEIDGLSLFISLPAHDEAVAGAVTGCGDLHAPKVAGIQAALTAGLSVSINHVVCRQNLPHVETFVSWLADRFAPPPRHLIFSFPLPAGRARTEGSRTIPRYREAAPVILAGLKRADAMGLPAHVAGICGIPTCVEPALRDFPEPHPEDYDQAQGSDRVRFPGCGACPWSRRCPGVPMRYLELYGADEFATLLAETSSKE